MNTVFEGVSTTREKGLVKRIGNGADKRNSANGSGIPLKGHFCNFSSDSSDSPDNLSRQTNIKDRRILMKFWLYGKEF